ncbi:MBL fold metallo-hydrolase [Thermodesulfobacteriota bacterium]
MRRRDFLKSLFSYTRYAALAGLLPATIIRNQAMASDQGRKFFDKVNKISLRELSENKIHHHNGRFLNPFNSRGHKSFWTVLNWRLFKKNNFEDLYDRERVVPVNIDWRPIRDHHGCAVTFIKHASIMIKDDDQFFLVDPVFNSFFWYTDFSPLAIDLKEMPSPDNILITHGHYDHLDMETLAQFDNKTHVISPIGYRGLFNKLKIKRHTQLDWFETFSEKGTEIICLPCNHWSMRNPITGPNTSLWSSFLIRTKSGVNIYVSGDTAYFDRFNELGKEFPIDLAIFNLGAYEPRWFMADSHINPAETVRAFRELRAKHLMVVHWGSFRLGDEPVYLPPRDIRKEMDGNGLTEKLLNINSGQTLFYEDNEHIRIL